MVGSCLRRRVRHVSPSSSGILMSSRTTSGFVSRTVGTTRLPTETSDTISKSSASASARRTAASMSRWSSATSTRKVLKRRSPFRGAVRGERHLLAHHRSQRASVHPPSRGCPTREHGPSAAHTHCWRLPQHHRTGTTRCVPPRSVRLSSPERVLFPDEGITKQDLFEYYRAIAPVLVPHLRNRPFTMKRSPYGVGGDTYFQKQAPKGMPSWIPTRTYRTYPREGESRLVDFPVVNSPEALLWMVQMNCIDMNAWYSRVDKPHRPDFVLFDLDPPDGGFELAIEVAHLIRELLAEVGLRGYVKTSGADGIHVLVPVTRRSTHDSAREFAEEAAGLLARRHDGLVTTEWRKGRRAGGFPA